MEDPPWGLSQGTKDTGLHVLPESWLPIRDLAQAERGVGHSEEGLTRQALRETWTLQVTRSHSLAWLVYAKCCTGVSPGNSLVQGERKVIFIFFLVKSDNRTKEIMAIIK